MAQTKNASKGLRCDVCEKKDGMHGFTLQTCKTCGVSVHTSCYGLASTTKNDKWECHACRSIASNDIGIKPLTKRPSKCLLCSVKNGIHAMHQLYDTHGKKGKPIGWVHTLCALAIGANAITKGAVYGCDEHGFYEGDDVSVELESEHEFGGNSSSSSDEEMEHSTTTTKSINKRKHQQQQQQQVSSSSPDANNEPELSETHHFAICSTTDNSVWANVIRESRTLKCILCNQRDSRNGVLRIPIQCEAGGEEEAPELLSRRKRTRKETCYLAMHVGCARWRGDSMFQSVFFFPGMNQMVDGKEKIIEPRCCLYCNTHAKDIYYHPKISLKPTTTATTTATTPAAVQNVKQHGLQGFNAIPAPSFKRKSDTNLESTPDSKRSKLSSPPVSPKVMESIQQRSTTIATPPLSPSPLLLPKSPYKSKAELFPLVLKYVFYKLKTSTRGKEVEATRQAKDYWKLKSNLSSNEFKDLWNKIKETVSKKVKNEKNSRTRSNSFTSIDSNVIAEYGKKRSCSITSIDSNVIAEYGKKRSCSITSNDSTAPKELKRSCSITSIDSTLLKEIKFSSSLASFESSILNEIITTTDSKKKINSFKKEKIECSNDNPWASLWMPDYQRNSDTFMLLLD